MEPGRNHFELAFFPKSTGVIKKFEDRLKNTEGLEAEVRAILSQSNITPGKIFISKGKTGKGKDKISDMFEGFKYKEYKGKVRGTKTGLFRDKSWKSDFSIYMLYGKNRDGLLYQAEDEESKEARLIGQRIYSRLMQSVLKQGPVPWRFMSRSGPAAK